MLLTKVKAETGGFLKTLVRRVWPFRRPSPHGAGVASADAPAAAEAAPTETPSTEAVTTETPATEPAVAEIRVLEAAPAQAPHPRRWRRVAVISGALVLALLVGGGTAAFANDAFTRERLLRGTRIGGVYIGGDTLPQADRKLTRRYVDPLRQPIVISAADVNTETTPWDLGLRLDVDSLLRETYERQRHMNIWERLVTWARGDRAADTDVAPHLDKSVLTGIVKDLARRVSRPVQNASLSFARGRLLVVPDRTGRDLNVADAIKRVTAAVSNGAGHVGLPVKETQAEHKASDFARVIVIRGGSNLLDLYQDGALAKTYGVATGVAAYPTPMGQFYVVGKQRNPAWINPHSSWSVGMPEYIAPGPGNPLGTRAIQLDANAIYIHGTPNDASIGTHASHGCVRMHMADVEELYERVGVGTPVLIVPD